MKTSRFLLAPVLAFSFATLFSACTEAEDPVPTTPDQQNPTGIPDLGGLGGGNPQPDPNTPTDGNQQPDPSGTEALGVVVTSSERYEFPEFLGVEAQSQPNDAGAYPVLLYYGDQEAANDTDGDSDVEGVVTTIAFNAARANGVAQPGQYDYQAGSTNADEFSYIFVMDWNRIYLLADAQIQVDATTSNQVNSLSFEGQAVEIEIVDGQASVASDPFEMNGQFLIPASLSTQQGIGARTAPRSLPIPDLSEWAF